MKHIKCFGSAVGHFLHFYGTPHDVFSKCVVSKKFMILEPLDILFSAFTFYIRCLSFEKLKTNYASPLFKTLQCFSTSLNLQRFRGSRVLCFLSPGFLLSSAVFLQFCRRALCTLLSGLCIVHSSPGNASSPSLFCPVPLTVSVPALAEK